jgi:prepilin-type N-terminal cleavage/methylation domain-containing protein
MRDPRGYSLVELVVVLVLIGSLGLAAYPALVRARARAEVAAAREAFASTHSMARQLAARFGRVSRLRLEPAANRFWLVVDTASLPGVTALDTVGGIVAIGERFAGVWVDGEARTFCFDARGLATARGDCSLPNATLVFRRGDLADTLTVSRLGRLLPR